MSGDRWPLQARCPSERLPSTYMFTCSSAEQELGVFLVPVGEIPGTPYLCVWWG